MDLSPRALEVLAVLVRHAGRVVSKTDLLDAVWPHSSVEEGNLAVHIFALRRALGEDAATAACIETIPKRGYRFAAPLSQTATATSHSHDLQTIAVHYLQQQTGEGCRKAASVWRKCLAADPSNTHATIGLANTLLFRVVLGELHRDAALPRAHELLRRVTEIDPSSAELHLSRSRLLFLAGHNRSATDEALQRAFDHAADPQTRALISAWHGFDLVARGEFSTGLSELRRAAGACPLSTFLSRMLADACFLAREFPASIAASREALQLHPACGLLHRSLGKALTAVGELGQARKSYRRARVLTTRPQLTLLAEIAYLDALAGDRARAAAFLSRHHQMSGVVLAEIHTALGDHHRALDCIDQAFLTRDWTIAILPHNPRLDPLRHTSRFRAATAKLTA